jgi:hypothetical protein
MDDHSWMCRGSPKWLYRMNYCNEIQSFINSDVHIRDVHIRDVRIKNFSI